MTTERPPIEPYTGEPWEPRVFKKGDRVRFRLGERQDNPCCGHHGEPRFSGGEFAIYAVLPSSAPSACGGCFSKMKVGAYRYEIDYPHWHNGHFFDSFVAAAVELEPLEGE